MSPVNCAEASGNDIFDATYKKWRRLLFRTNIICSVVIFLTEVIMYFVFKAQNLFLQPVPVYLFRFLILPTLIDIVILAGGWFLGVVFKDKQGVLDYIPVVQLTLICFMVSTIHHVFGVTFCTFCFPIFVTVIFDDRSMTAWITVLSFIFLTAAQIMGPWLNNVITPYLLPEYFVALIALLGANIICSVLARFQDEKNNIIMSGYEKQVYMMEQLNLDQKTGLYGNNMFLNRLSQIAEGKVCVSNPALAIFDIDNFKQINDTFGHGKGDEVIIGLAGIMKEMCGTKYMPVRFGGEEFAVIFTGGCEDSYFEFTEEIRRRFLALKYSFTEDSITLSAGLAIWEEGLGSGSFFDRADEAMYKSKQSGKNRTTIYKK